MIPGAKISKGNSKLGSIPNVSLTPIKACANCSGCKRSCYALKAWRQYPATREAWSGNLETAKKAPAVYFGQIQEYLAHKKPAFFRWHVAGDILGQWYLDIMGATARRFPGTRFLCFTKRGDLNYAGVPENLRIVFSQWPGMDLIGPEGSARAWLSTDPRKPARARKCPGSCEDCKLCFNLKTAVQFDPH